MIVTKNKEKYWLANKPEPTFKCYLKNGYYVVTRTPCSYLTKRRYRLLLNSIDDEGNPIHDDNNYGKKFFTLFVGEPQIKELESKIKSLTTEKNKQEDSITELQGKIQDLESKISELEIYVEKFNSNQLETINNNDNKNDLTNAEQNLKSAKKETEKAKNELTKMYNNLSQIKKNMVMINKEYQKLKANLEQIDSFCSNNVDYEKKLNEAENALKLKFNSMGYRELEEIIDQTCSSFFSKIIDKEQEDNYRYYKSELFAIIIKLDNEKPGKNNKNNEMALKNWFNKVVDGKSKLQIKIIQEDCVLNETGSVGKWEKETEYLISN